MKQNLKVKGGHFRFKRFSHKTYSIFNSMKKVVSIGVITKCMLAFVHLTTGSAQAIVHPEHEKIPEKELEEITVTASRAELPLSQTARLVTIITKEEIQQAPVQSIQDLLNYSSNIDIQQRGGHGVQADVSIRGGSFDQTAILLNGINLSNPQTGHYSFDLPVNLSDIERIEIIHGPSSALYGASAFSGGINIITRKKPDYKAFARIQAGGHALFGSEARGVIDNPFSINQFSVGYNRSDGYISNSNYDIFNFLWQTHIKTAGDKSSVNIQAGYNDKKYGANTFYSALYPDQYDKTNSIFASVKGETGDILKFIPSIYWNRHNDCFQLIRGDASQIPYNYHRTDVYGSNLNLQYTSRAGITSIGAEFRNEGIQSSVLGKEKEKPDGRYTHAGDRTNISYAGEHTLLLSRFSISAGILANYNTALNGNYKFFPSVNGSYSPINGMRLYISWNKAMRMPTFTDLYYNTATHKGNAYLNYEKSESVETGMKYTGRFFRTHITAYYMKGKDLIDWVWMQDPEIVNGGLWQSENLAKVYKKGIEADITFYLGELSCIINPATTIKLGYTRMNQNGRNSSGQMNSNYILNYLRDKFTAQFNLPVYKDFSLTGNFRWQKRMGKFLKYENGTASESKFPAFSTLDLRLNWVYDDFTFNLNANNIFNTRYYDLGNVPQAGFWLSGGISYTIR